MIPYHFIPNICVGKWGGPNKVNAMFPKLYTPGSRYSKLTQEEHATFFEKGLRPAMVEVLADRAADIQPDYKTAYFIAQGHNGRLAFATNTLSYWLVEKFGKAIRSNLQKNGVDWAEGMLYYHQIRGTKNQAFHSLTGDAALAAWKLYLEHNDLDLTDMELAEDQWWVDVAIETTSSAGQCLVFRTDSHAALVKRASLISTRHAVRVTSLGSSLYRRHPASHLMAGSGFAQTDGPQSAGAYDMVCKQAYHTDKSVTTRPDGHHHGKFLTGNDIIRGKADAYIDKIYEVYTTAAETNTSHARFEVRVPITHATKVLLNFDAELLTKSLLGFDREVWWYVQFLSTTF